MTITWYNWLQVNHRIGKMSKIEDLRGGNLVRTKLVKLRVRHICSDTALVATTVTSWIEGEVRWSFAMEESTSNRRPGNRSPNREERRKITDHPRSLSVWSSNLIWDPIRLSNLARLYLVIYYLDFRVLFIYLRSCKKMRNQSG